MSFDTKEFPFHQLIAKFIDKGELDTLKSNEEDFNKTDSFYKNMESAPIFIKLYEALEGIEGEAFYQLYTRFISEVIRPQFQEPIYYQRKPSHRILFRDIEGVARFHKDSDYGHDESEINYWVPQTNAFGTNSIWIEKTQGKSDYACVDLDLGEYLKFHGAVLSHGAKANMTNKTRVSFDFRVIPASKFNEAMASKDATDTSTESKNPVMSNARKFGYCE
ncbi:streptomycin biosynthesis protein strG [Nonlabens marinus S1-08]|uniref:Streptomycin biosynthesis protein strG n=2 Tax=Nonlabens TaxID=363408 RepID=W8VX69_9FLAO|nr:streptomycin biosynthesis protein strG [Nonlabens marinus S1-08]